MPSTDLVRQPDVTPATEGALLHGDLGKLSPEDRLRYYRALCESLGLNPLTRPFMFIKGDGGQLVLYAGSG